MNTRAEWHPCDVTPFFGPERFVEKMAKETILPPVFRRASLKPTQERGNPSRNCPPGYCAAKAAWQVVILLAGGDKRTQLADIKTALRLARNL